MSTFESSTVPWSKLTNGTSSLSAPGQPHMEKKLSDSGTSDSDAKDVGYIIMMIIIIIHIRITEIQCNLHSN